MGRLRGAHRTFAGMGSGGGGSGGGGALPRVGLMFNVQGDIGLLSGGGVPTGWIDTSGIGQNLDTVGGAPATGVFSIDGIPTVSFPTIWGNNGIYIGRNANMVRSDGVTPLGTGPRTVMMMVLPQYGGVPGIAVTGGPLFAFQNQSVSYQCMFELGPQAPAVGPGWSVDGAYCWASGWTPLFGTPGTPINEFGPIPSVAAGPYDNVPTLLEWRSTGAADLTFLVNNVVQTISPATRGAGGITPLTGFLLGNSQPAGATNFFGAIAQASAWDYNLGSDAVAHAQAVSVFASRYPSAPIAV